MEHVRKNGNLKKKCTSPNESKEREGTFRIFKFGIVNLNSARHVMRVARGGRMCAGAARHDKDGERQTMRRGEMKQLS